MCYTIEQLERRAAKRAKHDLGSDYKPGDQFKMDFHSVSGFAHPQLLVVTIEEPQYVQHMQWGLIPPWIKSEKDAKDISDKTLNAKSETIFEKPSFRSIAKKRCLLPVEGFFEWRAIGKNKYPYFIRMKDKETFYLGCLYDTWMNHAKEETVNSFSIITTAANPLMSRIHNQKERMPFVVPYDKLGSWLDPKAKKEDLQAMMRTFGDDAMEGYTISKLITSRTDDRNVPAVIEPCEYPEIKD